MIVRKYNVCVTKNKSNGGDVLRNIYLSDIFPVDTIEPVFDGEDDETRGVAATSLHHDIGAVFFYGTLAYKEAVGDFLI